MEGASAATQSREKSTNGNEPLRYADVCLHAHRHMCAFFHSADEEYKALLPFIRDGFEHGHKALHVVDPNLREDHRQRLRQAGIDTTAAEQSGQLDLRNWADAYLRDGRFDQDRMLALITEVLEGGRKQGYSLTRMVAHMEWALEGRPGVDDLVEYEAKVNEIWPKHSDAVVCVYDLAKFGGNIVVDIIRTHPVVLIGGILHENPYYTPPAEFLRERRSRGAPRAS
jgi:hypothetical protein